MLLSRLKRLVIDEAAVILANLAAYSPDSQHSLIPLYMLLREKETVMQRLPGLCTAVPMYCDDIATSPIYAPLHGDPRFEKLVKQYTTITQQ